MQCYLFIKTIFEINNEYRKQYDLNNHVEKNYLNI